MTRLWSPLAPSLLPAIAMSAPPSPRVDEKLSLEKTAGIREDVIVLPGTTDVYDGEESGVDPVYYAKARILNDAIQEIGMGKYQVRSSYSDRRAWY